VVPKNVPVISLAKKEERVFSTVNKQECVLDCATPEGKLLIAVRDYAHHIAITYNRRKLKNIFKNIKGIYDT